MNKIYTFAILFLAVFIMTACNDDTPPAPAPTVPPDEFVLYGWEGDFPPEVLTAFGEENNVATRYVIYESQEEALANIRAGQRYDVVVLDNQLVQATIQEGLLAPIDHTQLPNFRNVSANFRDLSYDPGNRYSIPYNWGTVGIIVRTDQVDIPVTAWADFWKPEFEGKLAIWGTARYVVGMALKSLGYSVNSEDPAELAAARERLLALRPGVVDLFTDTETLTELMQSGEVLIALGFAGDVIRLREANVPIAYILPDEGTMLWGDNYTIPANNAHPALAHRFLNYVLTPEVGAQIFNYNYYATPNEAALPLADPALANDPVIIPPLADLEGGEVLLPLSPATVAIYDEIWEVFAGQETAP